MHSFFIIICFGSLTHIRVQKYQSLSDSVNKRAFFVCFSLSLSLSLFFFFFFWEKESSCTSRQGQRERERILSRIHTQHRARGDLMTLRSWFELKIRVWHLTNWATQVSLSIFSWLCLLFVFALGSVYFGRGHAEIFFFSLNAIWIFVLI